MAIEESDLAARIAIGASSLAAAYTLGEVILGGGFLGGFHYLLTRSLIYAATLLGGCIIAGGFLSRARTAHFCAVVATTAIVAYYLVRQLGLPGEVVAAIRVGYGVALLGGVIVWGVRAIRRWFLPAVPDVSP